MWCIDSLCVPCFLLDAFLRRKQEEMQRVPCFGEAYTGRRKVTPAMKQEMNARMKDRIGYVV